MARIAKSDKVDMRLRILGSLEAKKLKSKMSYEDGLGCGAMPGLSMDQRFAELGRRIGDHVEAERGRKRGMLSTDHPWLHGMPEEKMVVELEQRLHLSERVVADLMREMVLQMAVSDELTGLLRIARERLVHGGPGTPQGIVSFARRLHEAGLLTKSVKDMSRGSVESIVALLNGDLDPELAGMVGLGKSSRYVPDDVAERALEESARVQDERRETIVDVEEPSVPAVIEPVVPEGFSEPWNYADGPLPPEYWSTVQDMSMPYSWEYRMARPEEEDSVLGMPLPEAHDWAAMRTWDRHFREIASERIRTKRGAVNNVRDVFAAKRDIDPEHVDMNTVRTWLLLLVARFMPAEDCAVMFDVDYFEGVVMPCPATGAGVVRQLVRKEV